MKPPFQGDADLLADIAAARAAARTRLWWLGQSGFLALIGGRAVLFDPYLSDSLTAKYAGTDRPHERVTARVVDPRRLGGIDVVTSSHNHTDHLDAETLLPLLAANPGAKLLVPEANIGFVLERLGDVGERLVGIDAGGRTEVAGVEFFGIPAAHNEVERDARGRSRFLGYVARAGGIAIYHSGDTLWHEGLAAAVAPFAVDVALLPINGNRPERRVAGNMSGAEAARFARAVVARVAVPHHFDMFAFNTEPPDAFEAECRRVGQPFRVLRNGEGMDIP